MDFIDKVHTYLYFDGNLNEPFIIKSTYKGEKDEVVTD